MHQYFLSIHHRLDLFCDFFRAGWVLQFNQTTCCTFPRSPKPLVFLPLCVWIGDSYPLASWFGYLRPFRYPRATNLKPKFSSPSCELHNRQTIQVRENARLWSVPNVSKGFVTAQMPFGQMLYVLGGPEDGPILNDGSLTDWFYEVNLTPDGGSVGYGWVKFKSASRSMRKPFHSFHLNPAFWIYLHSPTSIPTIGDDVSPMPRLSFL
jgi:hypothetical protein